jgi:hypothetical protein
MSTAHFRTACLVSLVMHLSHLSQGLLDCCAEAICCFKQHSSARLNCQEHLRYNDKLPVVMCKSPNHSIIDDPEDPDDELPRLRQQPLQTNANAEPLQRLGIILC